MRALRRILAPLALARAHLARRRARLAFVGCGLAGGAATVAAVVAGSLVARDQALGRAITEIPVETRAVKAVWFGVPAQAGTDHGGLEREARRALRLVDERKAVSVGLYRRTSIRGALVDLGAVDGLAAWVRLRSGRLPTVCRPARCEVLHVGGHGRVPEARGLRLVVVGRGDLVSKALFGNFVDSRAYHQLRTPPFLLAEGVSELMRVRELESIYRSYAWVVPLAAGSLHPWETDGFDERVARARSVLQAAEPSFDVTAPTSEVAAAGDAGRAAGRRLLLIGGEAGALLLAFAVLAAATLRRDAEAGRRRLTWFGVERWQLELMTGAEAGGAALAATLVGWSTGIAASAVIARLAGSPPGAVLRHSVLSVEAFVLVLALAAVATLVLFGSVRARRLRLGGLAFSPLDVAAVGALAVIAVGLAGGETDADALAQEGGTGVVLLLLPALAAFVAAVVCARAVVPVLRALERTTRRAAPPLRLASLSLARHPGYAAIAVAFLAVSLGLALFAESYRSTLAQGQEDQASYSVAADIVVREDLTQLVKPLEAAPLAGFRGLTRGVRARPVLRLFGAATRLEASKGVTALGLPPRTLVSVSGWRNDFSSLPRSELARRLAPDSPARLRGIELPPDAKELRLPVAVRGQPVGIDAAVAARGGTFVSIDLGRTTGRPREVLRAPVPQAARGGRLVALTFRPPRRIEEPGAAAGRAARGVLTAGRLLVTTTRGTAAAGFQGWIGANGVAATEAGARTRFHYALTNQVVSRFRPRQPTDEAPVPVLATPRVAAVAGPNGTIPIDLSGRRVVARVVATVARFPSIEGDGVVADRELLLTALNADAPGSAVANEIWLDVPDGSVAAVSRELARPPFDALEAVSLPRVRERLRADPLAQAALVTLAAAALVALALALAGLLLGVVSDLRDERGEFFELEADGAAPSDLRRLVRLRALVVAAIGLVGGIVTGALLSLLVVGFVRLTANATAPEPPLVLAVDWPVVVVAVASYAVLAAVLVLAVAARAFRASAVPARVSELAA